MFVRWEHKSFSKGSRLQGLCLFLAGAGKDLSNSGRILR